MSEEEKVDSAATAKADEDEEEYEQFKADYIDISELDPGDGRLFPNMCKEYYDAIKWLINPKDVRVKPPLYIFGDDLCRREVPEYNCEKLRTGGEIQIGQEFDVVSLMSFSCRGMLRVGSAADDFVKPETLIGKYVLLVCVFAPARWVERNSQFLCQLRIVSDQLSQAQNFEMVIIPKIRKNCRASKAAFHNLLSAFHGRLFVPFEDDVPRDQICQRLNFDGTLKAILVDPTRKVAQAHVSHIVANYYYPYRRNNIKLKYLSPDWIRPPSTLQEVKKIYLSSSLAWLLDSSYGDPRLRLHSLSSDDTITVGQLSNKLVGLYLYQVGDKLDSFSKVYNQCREKGLDFHIVVVCISLLTSVDPLVFHRLAIGELQKLIPDTPWWVLPYDAATYSNLFNLTMGLSKDRMITVGPRRKFFVDVHGGGVIHSYGIRAYPFNREMIVRKYELGAKAITLDSLLIHGPVDYVVRGGKRVPVADLRDKVVVLYACFRLEYGSCSRYKYLAKWYNEIRKQHSDFEVVVVYYDKPEDSMIENEKHSSPDIDLLVRPFDPEHSRFLREHESFFMCNNGHGHPVEGLGPDSMLLFGKGGHLYSLNALLCFSTHGVDAYPDKRGCGYNDMRDEIISSLAFEFDFMCGYRNQKPYDVVSLDQRSTRGK